MKVEGPPSSNRSDSAMRDPIMEVSRQFESVFVNQLIGAMRSTVIKDGYVPESHAEKIYQALLDQEYSNRIADAEQIGLSRVIYEQLVRQSK